MCSNLRSYSRCFSIKIWAFPWEMFGSLNYPICSCWYSRDFYFFHSVSGKIRIQFLAKMKGVVRENWRLAHILNIKQANCKEETFLPLEGKRTSSLPSILILPSCPPAIRHTLSEASQQLQPCLKSSNRVPTSDIIINSRKKAFSKY